MSPDHTEHRQYDAWLVAAQCTEVLRQRYGARSVIPFGSLVGDGPWHAGSDLDLAVERLSTEALWEAAQHLGAMVPSWLAPAYAPLSAQQGHGGVWGALA